MNLQVSAITRKIDNTVDAETELMLLSEPLGFVEKIGPVYFKGKSPFTMSVVIVTNRITTGFPESNHRFITYVGFKKENEEEYDFDEMIPTVSFEEAMQTHQRTCRFFMNSALFVKV